MTTKPRRMAAAGVPQVQSTQATEEAARVEFYLGAPGKATPPWKAAKVRPDMMMQLNVNIPEPLMLKLIAVCTMTDTSKRAFTEKALAAALDAELRRMGVDPG